ncbi:hypothetical protein HC766_01400 [Candidatus Gracilibacteria bacterium]|nr:hypothetical protein [Thermales bacterium]NJL96831.1 hypothetical protein [Candidatus Gracilibacteria bacterium]NJS41030.1 hypothetical protein [Candidatus Gracilibacteria bacterium]
MKVNFNKIVLLSAFLALGFISAPAAMASSEKDSSQSTPNNSVIEKDVTTNTKVISTENSPRSSVSNTNVGGAYFSVNNDGAANRTQLDDCGYAVASLGIYASGSSTFGNYGDYGNPGAINLGAYYSHPFDSKGKGLCQEKYATSNGFAAIRACLDLSSKMPAGYVFTSEDWITLANLKPEVAQKYAALCNKMLASKVKVVEKEMVPETIETPTKAHPSYTPTPPVRIPASN